MIRLYQEHDFERKLATCKTLSVHEPQSEYHETFCCTRELVRYFDAQKTEIAVIVYQVDSHGDSSKNLRIIMQLRVDNDVYTLALN
jgi:hypothetical protein